MCVSARASQTNLAIAAPSSALSPRSRGADSTLRGEQGPVDALGEILLRRNTKTEGYDVEIGGGIAHLHSGDCLLGREPVAEVVDPAKSGEALARSHAIKEIMTSLLGSRGNIHLGSELGTDGCMRLPRRGATRMATAIQPIAQNFRKQWLYDVLLQRPPSRIGRTAIVDPPLLESRK